MHTSVTIQEATAPVKLPIYLLFIPIIFLVKQKKKKNKVVFHRSCDSKTTTCLYYYFFFLKQIIVKVHRVFPSSCTQPHLHGKFKFTGIMLETAKQSLRRSCRTELTRQGILLPQDHQSYGRRLLLLVINSANR